MLLKFTISLLFAITACFFAIGQEQPYDYKVRVDYKMTFQPDSLDKNSTKSELMSLLIGNQQSIFCAREHLIMDSAKHVELAKGSKFGLSWDFLAKHNTKIWQTIFKTDSSILHYDELSRFIFTMFWYSEPRNLITWNILPDTMNIAGIPCQKAEADFGKRHWVAWFAPSLPISEGPYKFCGLPGLILKIADTQNYWQFEVASLYNINKTLNFFFLKKKLAPLKDKAMFLSRKKEARDNAWAIAKAKGVTSSNEAATIQENAERAKKDNNWIELPDK